MKECIKYYFFVAIVFLFSISKSHSQENWFSEIFQKKAGIKPGDSETLTHFKKSRTVECLCEIIQKINPGKNCPDFKLEKLPTKQDSCIVISIDSDIDIEVYFPIHGIKIDNDIVTLNLEIHYRIKPFFEIPGNISGIQKRLIDRFNANLILVSNCKSSPSNIDKESNYLDSVFAYLNEYSIFFPHNSVQISKMEYAANKALLIFSDKYVRVLSTRNKDKILQMDSVWNLLRSYYKGAKYNTQLAIDRKISNMISIDTISNFNRNFYLKHYTDSCYNSSLVILDFFNKYSSITEPHLLVIMMRKCYDGLIKYFEYFKNANPNNCSSIKLLIKKILTQFIEYLSKTQRNTKSFENNAIFQREIEYYNGQL